MSKNIVVPEFSGHRLLVYYYAFPHYRVSVLKELQNQYGGQLDVVSGTASRGGLKILTDEDLPQLDICDSIKVGPFTWEKQIFRRAISSNYSSVIVAPAVSSLSTWSILIARRLLGRRTYLWGQCGKPRDRSRKRLAQELMNRFASGLLVYGNLEESGAIEYGTPRRKVTRVRNAVPLRPLSLSKDALQEQLLQITAKAIDFGELKIVYSGRINEDKNVEVLLQAGELLKDAFPKLSILLIGDGSDSARLRNAYQDPRYKFLGAIYDKDKLQNELLQASLIVSPSTMGLLALDALSVGIPVMVPDNPFNGSEVEALTPGVNSFSFRHDNPNDLATQIMGAIRVLQKINIDHYYVSREEKLRDWSPEGVANNILSVIVSSPKPE